jgi:hypothetical protein
MEPVTLGKFYRHLARPNVRADDDNVRDTFVNCPVYDILHILVKLRKLKMRMSIN